MKRPAQPEEIAPADVFLAANQCSGPTTGETLPVIGGYSGGQHAPKQTDSLTVGPRNPNCIKRV